MAQRVSDLIDDYMSRTGKTYEDMHHQADGQIAVRTLRALHYATLKSWPRPEVIRGLALALDISEVSALLAIAQDFGVADDSMPLLCHELPPTTHVLTQHERTRVVQFIHDLTRGR